MEKRLAEINGLEYDWLAMDGDGCVALFSTYGGGYAPVQFLRDTDAHDGAIGEILQSEPTTVAILYPSVKEGFENTWKLVAERGLYAFESDPDGGPYRRIAMPRTAVRVQSLPSLVRDLVRRVRFERLCFAEQYMITDVQIVEVEGGA